MGLDEIGPFASSTLDRLPKFIAETRSPKELRDYPIRITETTFGEGSKPRLHPGLAVGAEVFWRYLLLFKQSEQCVDELARAFPAVFPAREGFLAAAEVVGELG